MEVMLENIIKTRCLVYEFLSKSFYLEPKVENFQDSIYELKSFLAFNDTEQPGVDLIRHFIKDLPLYQESDWSALFQEYQRLFVGPESLPAPPWESVYRSRDHIILDEHTLAVREYYRRWGLETKNLYHEPDDHIGLELEFIYTLSQKTLTALTKGNAKQANDLMKAQVAFLQEHMLQWVPLFCERLARGTEHPLYLGSALFTPDFIRMDKDLLDDVLKMWDET